MTTTMLSTAVVISEPMFSDAERVALGGYLAGYSGLTREAYALDLRQFAAWCEEHNLRLFEARRADIECFGRDLEERGRARATVARRLCTVAGFYRYAVEEELLEHSPAVHVRRPASTTSRTSPGSTATNSALYLWPPGSEQPSSTP